MCPPMLRSKIYFMAFLVQVTLTFVPLFAFASFKLIIIFILLSFSFRLHVYLVSMCLLYMC